MLKRVTENEKELLRNVNQKYLYEMTRYYPEKMDEKGTSKYCPGKHRLNEEETVLEFSTE